MGETQVNPDESDENNPIGDRSDQTITPKEAWELTEEKGIPGKLVAQAYDITESWVSQRKAEYEEARQDGKESVGPDDFEPDELRNALGDEPADTNPYEHTCPECGDLIEPPNTAGKHPCPACGQTLEWSEDEI